MSSDQQQESPSAATLRYEELQREYAALNPQEQRTSDLFQRILDHMESMSLDERREAYRRQEARKAAIQLTRVIRGWERLAFNAPFVWKHVMREKDNEVLRQEAASLVDKVLPRAQELQS